MYGDHLVKRRLLVVDDEPAFHTVVLLACRHSQWDVYSASDSQSALSAAMSLRPDVALVDLMLGRESGLQCLISLRRHLNVPVVMITGRADDSELLKARLAGASACLVKPVRLRILLDTLGRAADRNPGI